jgi:hypothetical protein
VHRTHARVTHVLTAAVCAQARAKAAAEAGKSTMTARNWAERNVAGAKDEKDAELIRGMNEFLQ